MQIILVLIGFSFVAIISGKINWKNEAVRYTVIASIALLQTLFILYKMLSMQFPFA